MVRLTPRLESQVARGDVGLARVVLEVVHERVPIIDAPRYPYLPLLEGGHSPEDEVTFGHRPVAIGSLWAL